MEVMMLVISFFGGVYGASVGALASFALVGFTGFVGIAAAMAGSKANWFGLVTFGSFFGPHISLVGGVVAAAFARKMGYMESAKDITKPLISLKKPSVLLVGGIFGVIGFVCQYYLDAALAGKLDTVAATVVLVPMIAKVLFGSDGLGEILGTTPGELKGFWGRFNLNAPSWVPYMVTASEKTTIGLGAGGLSAYTTAELLKDPATASVAVLVGFFISAAFLIWLQLGFPIPVTHHITLCASYAVAASGGNFYWGLAGALIATFFADFFSRLFYLYGDCHIDPPGGAIVVVSFLFLGGLPLTGLADSVQVPLAIVLAACIYSLVQAVLIKSKENTSTSY